jgi:hypothetical protein
MKKIPCSHAGCAQRRAHFASPDVDRAHQMVEVDDHHEGEAYCSFSCAILSGKMKVKGETGSLGYGRTEYVIDENGRCWLPPVESRMEGWARYEWFRKKTGLQGSAASRDSWSALTKKHSVLTVED